jgi:hypothetical protein
MPHLYTESSLLNRVENVTIVWGLIPNIGFLGNRRIDAAQAKHVSGDHALSPASTENQVYLRAETSVVMNACNSS